MMRFFMNFHFWWLTAAMLVMPVGAVIAGSNPYSGLWVGQAAINYVNEVSVPLDANNNPVAPNPAVPTPTADQAQIRLILHVNAAGQVSLLNQVAILNRTPAGLSTGLPVNPEAAGAFNEGRESDLALITDESLYGEFPPQAATRLASAVFDFGDRKTTEALDAVVEAAVTAAVAVVLAASDASFNSVANIAVVENSARTSAVATTQSVIGNADVGQKFYQFTQTYWLPVTVKEVATNLASPQLAAAKAQAQLLYAASFYRDTRALEMVTAVSNTVRLAIIGGVTSSAALRQAALNTTSSFMDTDDEYQRFIAGKVFGDMIDAVAATAAVLRVAGFTSTGIAARVDSLVIVQTARSAAENTRIALYEDTRASDAVELVLAEMVEAAAASSTGTLSKVLEISLVKAGEYALNNDVVRYPVSILSPTPDYSAFISSNIFTSSGQVAAQAAAAAAAGKRKNDSLYTAASVASAAKVAALEALRSVYSAAARSLRSSLPMVGSLAVGAGDARLSYALATNVPPLNLGPANGVTGEVFLPANHPTNPFRHRRHPDHTSGFDVTRRLRLDFDAQSNPTNAVGFGLDWITGVYREEIFGLHKSLGQPGQDPIGMKVEGLFRLQRISHIDTLNTL